jgi:hypothetical protein
MKKYKFIHFYVSLFLMTSFFTLTSCKSEGNGILGKQTVLTSDEDPDLKNAPFAYDVAADTISYNSCTIEPGKSDPNLHGLKISSSEGFVDNLGSGAVKGGLKLRSDFLQYVGQKFTPDYPSKTITPEQITRVLSASYSIFNADAKIQFAVRKKSDYSVIPDLIAPVAPITAVPPRDAIVFPQVLSSGYLGYSITKNISYDTKGIVLKEGPRNYNLSDSQDPVAIEASFAFNATTDDTFNTAASGIATEPYGKAEFYTQTVRDAFNANTQLLTVTFGGTDATTGVTADDAKNNTINNIKRPYKIGTGTATPVFDTAKAFGHGYNLKFESQTTALYWPKNRLTKVSEINLDTGTPTGGTTWSCEQFVIAHKSHWNNNKSKNPIWVKDTVNVEPNCAPLLANDTTCVLLPVPDTVAQCNIKKDRAEKIKRIRRQYSVENWNIGLMFLSAPRVTAGIPYTPPDRRTLDMCLAPKGDVSCYLPTVGILDSGTSVPAEKLLDIGIQYDRAQECYLTSTTLSGNRDTERKKGRCAQFASVCVRSSSNY